MPTIKRETVTIDATDKVVGRLATHIAKILMGKDQPGYTPHIDSGVIVKITNVDKLVFTGSVATGSRCSSIASPAARARRRASGSAVVTRPASARSRARGRR